MRGNGNMQQHNNNKADNMNYLTQMDHFLTSLSYNCTTINKPGDIFN